MTMPWRADRVLQWLQMAARYSRNTRHHTSPGILQVQQPRAIFIFGAMAVKHAAGLLDPSRVLKSLLILATVATVAQHQSSDATSGTTASVGAPSGGRRALHRLPNVAVQVHLEGYGINVSKVVQKYPHIAFYNMERVQQITSYLSALGVDVKRVVEWRPTLLAGQVEAFEAVVRLLRENGVDVVRTVNRHPDVLRRKVSSLQPKLDAIVSCGHSIADVVNRDACFLRSSVPNVSAMLQLRSRSGPTEGRLTGKQQPSTGVACVAPMDTKVALMSSLGLDADLLLRRAPRIINFRVDKMCSLVDYLKGLGVDAPKVLQKAPNLLGLLPETLQRRVQFLSENGLDVIRIVHGSPQVLALRVEKMKLMLDFLLQEMQYSPSQVNTAPTVWSLSLEGRLRPRLQYLKSLGRPYGSLTPFATFSDERFAARVAKTD
eukprot:EG_transcript_13179